MRTIWGMGAVVGLLVTGCAGETPEDRAAQARADAAAVEEILAANSPPPVDPGLQPMSYVDFERAGLLGASCAFVIGDQVIALAMADVGALRYDGDIQRLAPDAGSPERPYETRAKYDGREFSFRIEVSGEPKRAGDEVWSQPARLTVRDGFDRVVYRKAGSAECGA